MPETILNLYKAKTSLSKLVDRAASGEEVIIAKAGQPLAKLVPFRENKLPRSPGGWEGKIYIAEDFDAPLPDELSNAFYSGLLLLGRNNSHGPIAEITAELLNLDEGTENLLWEIINSV